MRKLNLLLIVIVLLAVLTGCEQKKSQELTKSDPEMVKQFDDFVKKFEAKYIPLYKETNLAYWNASITGKEEDFKKVADLQNKITLIFSIKEDFNTLKKLHSSKGIADTLKKRELEILYLGFLGNQSDTAKLNAINAEQNQIEQKFGNYRAEVSGKKLTDNERVDMAYKQKPESFSPDCEFRIVAIKFGEPCKEECKFLDGQFGQADPMCRFLPVNLGKQLNYTQLCES